MVLTRNDPRLLREEKEFVAQVPEDPTESEPNSSLVRTMKTLNALTRPRMAQYIFSSRIERKRLCLLRRVLSVVT